MADSQQVNATGDFVGEPLSEAVRVVALMFGWLFCVTGVFGNLLVIVTVLTQKALRSAYNLYIVNLAVADLVVCGYTSPFWMLDFHFGYHPVVNRTHCSCNAVILVVSYSVSLYNLVLIAFNRYLCVCRNALYIRLFSKSSIIISCAVLWIVATLLAVLPFFEQGSSAVIYGPGSHTCNFKSGKANTIIMLTNFTLPAILVGYFSASIFRAWKRSKTRIGQWAPSRGNQQHQRGTTQQTISASDVALIRSLILVFLLLVVLYLPTAVSVVLNSLKIVSLSADLAVSLMLLMFLNHSINWVVYGLMNKNFRNGYRQQMKNCCRSSKLASGDTEMNESTLTNRGQRMITQGN